ATALTFNGTSSSFTVNSSTSIQATVPTGATSGPLSVTTPGGTATSSSSFTVTASAPTITSFTQASGPVGSSVTISGTAFTGATAVTFNGVSASFTVNSATTIQATVPASATTGPISVTTPGGTTTSPTAFTLATRFEEMDPAVGYTGVWEFNNTIRPWSGGTAAISKTVGAQATFIFSGTAVNWIGFRGPQAGIARVFLDGSLVSDIDTFSTTEQVQAIVFSTTGLAAASQ